MLERIPSLLPRLKLGDGFTCRLLMTLAIHAALMLYLFFQTIRRTALSGDVRCPFKAKLAELVYPLPRRDFRPDLQVAVDFGRRVIYFVSDDVTRFAFASAYKPAEVYVEGRLCFGNKVRDAFRH
jgi:hypothetical protein